MAIANFSFMTNMEDSRDDRPTPTIGTIIFQKGDSYIGLGCCGWEDYGISNGCYSSRWKGLEYALYDAEYRVAADWNEPENGDEFYALMEGAKPVAFYPCEDDLSDSGYPNDFVPTCTFFDFFLEIGENHLSFHKASLPTEREWLKTISPQEKEEER